MATARFRAELKPRAPLQVIGSPLYMYGCHAHPAPGRHVTRYPRLHPSRRYQKIGKTGETIVTELSSKQAREKCHQTLVAGLRIIQPEERVTAIAAALQEIEAQEIKTLRCGR